MEHFEWAKDKIMMGNNFVVFLKIIYTFYSQPSLLFNARCPLKGHTHLNKTTFQLQV